MEKIYVDVIASIGTNGSVKPLSIIWENGREYMIEKVLGVLRGSAMKQRSCSDRYTILVRNKRSYLFLERGVLGYNNFGRWYIETDC